MNFQIKMKNFLKVQKGVINSITHQMSEATECLVKKNRSIISSLMSSMLLCIERGFALRGHDDGGAPDLSENADYINLGNFKSIVKFRAQCDTLLKEHLEKSSNYGKYISNTAQADFMVCILEKLQTQILDEAKAQSGKVIFAVSADEVTDASCSEQLGAVLRTVSDEGEVHERLIEYLDLQSMKGEAIHAEILECLQKHGLDVQDCRAQTYDGAANMSGAVNGCQAHIKRLQPLADYFHCASHKLNLALNSTVKINEFRVMIENVKRLGLFFHYSPKRKNKFVHVLEEENPQITIRKL